MAALQDQIIEEAMRVNVQDGLCRLKIPENEAQVVPYIRHFLKV